MLIFTLQVKLYWAYCCYHQQAHLDYESDWINSQEALTEK